ncbi:MAG: transporter, family, proline/betaine transporter [Bradyrhizobium sp.]|jgi:MFS family permease|nr:transporter, family, proline/betaine transporter [Bradyrhizobium sp.]
MASTIDTGVAAQVTDRQRLLAVFASCFGWSLDLFDLFILLYVAPVIGKLFFPSDHPTLSLAAVYASFTVTLLMRPVGSAIFGSYADRHGRKAAMFTAVCGVGIVTAAFGLLPTLAQVGLLAPIAFLALRLVQGVFVGGVVATTHTVGTESVPANWRGAVSGLVGGGGAGLGALLASLAFFVASSLYPSPEFEVWGWRVMFYSGILSSVLGLFILRYLEESPVWLSAKARRSAAPADTKSPAAQVFAGAYRNTLLVNLLITAGAGSAYYVTSGYLPTFLKLINKIPNSTASMILIGSALVATVTGPFIGYLSDRIGRRSTFVLIGIPALVLLPLMYLWMGETQNIAVIAGYAFAISFFGNAVLAPVPIFLNERFPTALRASGTGLSWNIGFAFGGMMPTFVSLASGETANIPTALAVFCFGSCLLLLIGAFVVGETKGRVLND